MHSEMGVFGISVGIFERLGFCPEGFPRGDRVGTVDIQFEIRDQEQMIPEFMSEVFLILELRIEESHEFDDGEGIGLSSFPILDGLGQHYGWTTCDSGCVAERGVNLGGVGFLLDAVGRVTSQVTSEKAFFLWFAPDRFAVWFAPKPPC